MHRNWTPHTLSLVWLAKSICQTSEFFIAGMDFTHWGTMEMMFKSASILVYVQCSFTVQKKGYIFILNTAAAHDSEIQFFYFDFALCTLCKGELVLCKKIVAQQITEKVFKTERITKQNKTEPSRTEQKTSTPALESVLHSSQRRR